MSAAEVIHFLMAVKIFVNDEVGRIW